MNKFTFSLMHIKQHTKLFGIISQIDLVATLKLF